MAEAVKDDRLQCPPQLAPRPPPVFACVCPVAWHNCRVHAPVAAHTHEQGSMALWVALVRQMVGGRDSQNVPRIR